MYLNSKIFTNNLDQLHLKINIIITLPSDLKGLPK
jgi:hypothetical protein